MYRHLPALSAPATMASYTKSYTCFRSRLDTVKSPASTRAITPLEHRRALWRDAYDLTEGASSKAGDVQLRRRVLGAMTRRERSESTSRRCLLRLLLPFHSSSSSSSIQSNSLSNLSPSLNSSLLSPLRLDAESLKRARRTCTRTRTYRDLRPPHLEILEACTLWRLETDTHGVNVHRVRQEHLSSC